ncbi:hypothetical protein PENTCL1PPCAC_105, partial [Pristionchus entomophagus]
SSDMITEAKNGMTRVQCFCDPTEATLNDHVPTPPPKKKCIEHHVFNETTQTKNLGKHDPKYCAELITHDGRRQMVAIPNWGIKRKEDFHVKIRSTANLVYKK